MSHVNLCIPRDVHRELKRRALDDDTTLAEVIVKALTKFVAPPVTYTLCLPYQRRMK